MNGHSAPIPVSNPVRYQTQSSDEEAPSPDGGPRRQRISMACQYCRHRKIRCCGNAPCRNCLRFKRECEFVPVPEVVNRATREKKAIAKATKLANQYLPPVTTTSPYFVPQPSYNASSSFMYGTSLQAAPYSHRRSSSVPSGAVPWGSAPTHSASSQWGYSGSNHFVPLPFQHSPHDDMPMPSAPAAMSHPTVPHGYEHNQLGIQLHSVSSQAHVLDSPSPTSTFSSASALTRCSSSDEEHTGNWSQSGLLVPLYIRPSSSGSLSQDTSGGYSNHSIASMSLQKSSPQTPSSSFPFPSPLATPNIFYSYPSATSASQQVPAYHSPSTSAKFGQHSSPMLAGDDHGLPTMNDSLVGLGLMDSREMHMVGDGSRENFVSHPSYY